MRFKVYFKCFRRDRQRVPTIDFTVMAINKGTAEINAKRMVSDTSGALEHEDRGLEQLGASIFQICEARLAPVGSERRTGVEDLLQAGVLVACGVVGAGCVDACRNG